MERKVVVLLLVAVFLLPGLARAVVTDEDFLVKTTQNLFNLCTAADDDPRHGKAIHFCHGYLIGAYDYHVSQNSGPDGKLLVCFPDPAPTRNAAIKIFVEWVKVHPQHMNEKPVDTEFRFLVETWPCKK
jgi:hypothetical protein